MIERLTVSIKKRTFLLHRPADLETIWGTLDESSFGEDERLPYWTELWPAAISLAEFLLEQQEIAKDKVCLDIGCGLGLMPLVLSLLRPQIIIGMDYEMDPLRYCRLSTAANQAKNILWLMADWRQAGFKPFAFNLITGTDILYEVRFHVPVVAFLAQHLAKDGLAFLAEPGRGVSETFWPLLAGYGLAFKKADVRTVYLNNLRTKITIYSISHSEI